LKESFLKALAVKGVFKVIVKAIKNIRAHLIFPTIFYDNNLKLT